jgi:preprotein translocase subunit SecA
MLGAMAGAEQVTAEQAAAAASTEEAAEPELAAVPSGAGEPREEAPHVEVSGVGVGRPRTGALHYSAPTETGEVEVRDEGGRTATATLTDEQMSKTPRNAPCPCGSGKKFKMCHGRR